MRRWQAGQLLTSKLQLGRERPAATSRPGLILSAVALCDMTGDRDQLPFYDSGSAQQFMALRLAYSRPAGCRSEQIPYWSQNEKNGENELWTVGVDDTDGCLFRHGGIAD